METEWEFDLLLSEIKRICPSIPEGYKKSYISRRILTRMRTLHIEDPEDYISLLRSDPGEASILIDRLTINVTCFFRDMEVFNIIDEKVLPLLISMAKAPLRIWSAGSSDGREAFSILLMIKNRYPHVFKSVKITATDIDDSMLEDGKKGIYHYGPSRNIRDEVPPHLIRELCIDGGIVRVPDVIRRKVRFLRHDLLRDEPIRSQDLILCRNFLIYLPSRSQERVLELLNASLKNGGFLVLGKSEHLPDSQKEDLELFDLTGRIYRKRSKNTGETQSSASSREDMNTDLVEG